MSYHSRALPSPAATTALRARDLSSRETSIVSLIACLYCLLEDACAFARRPGLLRPAGTLICQHPSLILHATASGPRLNNWLATATPRSLPHVCGGRHHRSRTAGSIPQKHERVTNEVFEVLLSGSLGCWDTHDLCIRYTRRSLRAKDSTYEDRQHLARQVLDGGPRASSSSVSRSAARECWHRDPIDRCGTSQAENIANLRLASEPTIS